MDVDFAWPVPADGFRWFSLDHDPKGRWLVAKKPGERKWLTTHPFVDAPRLFRDFAELDEDCDGAVLNFANQHGFLSPPEQLNESPTGLPGSGEARATWTEAIRQVRRAVRLWDAITARNEGEARRWLERVQHTWSIFKGLDLMNRRQRPLPVLDANDFSVVLPNESEFFSSARTYFVAFVNAQLVKQTSLAIANDRGSVSIHVVPASLEACLWTQLLREIAGETELHQCRHCRQPFTVDPAIGKRRHRQFCSEKCRAAAYRDRQEKAHQMHAKGMTPSAIAKKLESDPATVRGWLGSAAKTPTRKRS
jgi:hypothetical protein